MELRATSPFTLMGLPGSSPHCYSCEETQPGHTDGCLWVKVERLEQENLDLQAQIIGDLWRTSFHNLERRYQRLLVLVRRVGPSYDQYTLDRMGDDLEIVPLPSRWTRVGDLRALDQLVREESSD